VPGAVVACTVNLGSTAQCIMYVGGSKYTQRNRYASHDKYIFYKFNSYKYNSHALRIWFAKIKMQGKAPN
jgi:hypothetical protein